MAYDSRNINYGLEIPSNKYVDQPYVVVTDDDAWLCVMTTSENKEGEKGQTIVTTRSMDCGHSWSPIIALEPINGPESSYAVLLKNDFGRIYCFYNHNTDNVRSIIASNPPYTDGKCFRVDSLGYHVFRYSDDNGRSWSKQRYTVPIREMDIDKENPYNGKIQFFWNVGKPFILEGEAFISIHKVGGIGNGFFTRSEGVLVKSNNLNYEKIPEKLNWLTLPDGDFGLRAPKGGNRISEEHSYVTLSDYSIYSIYRTIDGHPARSYSRDMGHSWEEPEYETFSNGNFIKNPRAANFVWKCSNNKFLYWFHNHNGNWYEDRNPAWICGGVEEKRNGNMYIKWSEPEIALYDDDPYVRISYPDLLEYKNNYYIFETNKNKARVHRLNKNLIEGLWSQFGKSFSLIREKCIFEDSNPYKDIKVPLFEEFNKRDHNKEDYGILDLRTGITIEILCKIRIFMKNIEIIDSRSDSGQGVCVKTSNNRNFEVLLDDGRSRTSCKSDSNVVNENSDIHLVIVIDGGPKIIKFIVNGILCDGRNERQFGWSRFSPFLKNLNSLNYNWIVAPGGNKNTNRGDPSVIDGDESIREFNNFKLIKNESMSIGLIRFYQRALNTSEVVNNYRTIRNKKTIDVGNN